MSLKEQLFSDLKDSLRSGERLKVSVIRLILAALKNREIEKRGLLSDEEVIEILISLSKQRRESIEGFEKGGRQDLVAKETAELRIIQSYLPRQLTTEEIRERVREAITESGASGPKDVGRVMRVLMPKVKGRADGKLVNEMVREILGY